MDVKSAFLNDDIKEGKITLGSPKVVIINNFFVTFDLFLKYIFTNLK